MIAFLASCVIALSPGSTCPDVPILQPKPPITRQWVPAPPKPDPAPVDDPALGVTQWEPLVASHDGWSPSIMLKIMRCESGGYPRAVSHTQDYGLLQIHYPIWGPHFGVTREQLFDPETNIEIARRIWGIQGYGAWVCWE